MEPMEPIPQLFMPILLMPPQLPMLPILEATATGPAEVPDTAATEMPSSLHVTRG